MLRAPEDTVVLKWASEVERSGIQLVTAFDPEYPQALLEIADPPFLLYAVGRVDRLRLPAVSIVGSRDASRYGRDVASRLARELSAAGVAVVSGFARGIDAAAHEAALDSPGGTIAVLGCGIDVDYPREHRRLREKIARDRVAALGVPAGNGAASPEFSDPKPDHRGLSSGVVVVEASRRSGSLITARLASDFGRDVFAVPGSIFSETSAGTHELLRDGAILCRGAEDVLSELFPSVGPPQPVATARAVDLSAEARRLLDALAREESLSADDLAEALELPAATVLAGLFELEGAGLAVPVEGGRYGVPRR